MVFLLKNNFNNLKQKAIHFRNEENLKNRIYALCLSFQHININVCQKFKKTLS